MMYKLAFTALALLSSAVSAQSTTTTTLLLVGFDQQSIMGSVIASDATATTYSLSCGSKDSDDCGVPPSFTFTQGPSTMHYAFSYPGDSGEPAGSLDVACAITSKSGTCSSTVLGGLDSLSPATVMSTSFTDGGVGLGAQVVTIVADAGAAASSTRTVASTSASTTAASEASSSATRSGSSAPEKTVSSTTGSSASASSTSSVSTAGAAMVTGKAQWVVGGAAAALALAAM